MIQAMKVLQMDTMELREYIQEQLQDNPVLESEETAPSAGGDRPDTLAQQIEWIHSTDVQNSWYNREDVRDFHETVPGTCGVDPAEENLYDYLRAQIDGRPLGPALENAVECVLQSLNEMGRLDEPVHSLASGAGVSEDIMLRAVRLVQSLDPAGVAARDLSECLALQLIRQGETGLALTVVQNHLADLGRNHYRHIAQATGASEEEILAARERIRSLDPRPCAGFSSSQGAPGYIIPDLAVLRGDGGFEVIPNRAYIPSLHISGYYHRLWEATGDAQVRDYLSAKMQQAKWVMQAVEHRQSTLLSCAGCIVSRQEDFFRRGPGHLSPLSLSDISREMDVHESTVSRTIRNKSLQCVHGVFALKYFFSRALRCEKGEGVSTERAKAALRELIDQEDKDCPLSDQKLSERLTSRGAGISRRTVAKYRDEMGIPSASGRKCLRQQNDQTH